MTRKPLPPPDPDLMMTVTTGIPLWVLVPVELLLVAIIVAGAIVACNPKPTPIPATPTPNACETRVAVAMQTVDAAMATYVLLATAVAECIQLTPTYMPSVTPYATHTSLPIPSQTMIPVRCQSCTTASECPAGTTCYGYNGVLFCVPRDNLNGAYQECLRQMWGLTMHTYQGPPDELVNFEALTVPLRERRWEVRP